MASWGFKLRELSVTDSKSSAGQREVLKSSGVKSLLSQQGAKATAAANAAFHLSGADAYGGTTKPPYAYDVVVRKYTAGALVHVNSKLGHVDNVAHGTLETACRRYGG